MKNDFLKIISFHSLKNAHTSIPLKSNDYSQILAPMSHLVYNEKAILFRDFPIENEYDFQEFIKALLPNGKSFSYQGGTSPRTEVLEGVYTSTKMPFFQKIPLHSEMSYRKIFPRYLLLCCQTPPWKGGETPIADLDVVETELPKDLRDKVAKFGITYFRHLKNLTFIRKLMSPIFPVIEMGTWQHVFKSSPHRETVEEYCQNYGFEYTWQEDGSVCLKNTVPGFTIKNNCSDNTASKRARWFNSIHFFQIHPLIWGQCLTILYKIVTKLSGADDYSARLGNGEKISDKDISQIVKAYEKSKVTFKWKKGDILFLDNLHTAHGRNSYLGKRRVLVSLIDQGEFQI